MTDRDRLIELIRQGKDMTPCEKDNDYRCEGIKCADCESKSIADYLLANGVIVPPCKVGQMVYLFYPVRKGIYEAVVDEICLNVYKAKVKAEAYKECIEKVKNEIINDTAYACDSSQHSRYYDYQIKIGDIPEYIDNLLKEIIGE